MVKCIAVLLVCLSALSACSKSPTEKAAAHRAKATAYLKAGKLDEAVLELRNALQVMPKDKDALAQLGEAYFKQGQVGESFQSYRRAAELDPGNLDVQVRLGTFYVLDGKLAEAKKCADVVVARGPNRADGHVLLAKILLRDGKRDDAFHELDRAVELEPTHLETRLVRATALLGVGRLADARSAVDAVLAKDGGNATALLLLAQVSELQKDPKGAEEAFGRLLKAKPDDPGTWLNYGNFWLSRGDEKQGLAAFRKAGELEKKGTVGWEKLAEIYLGKGDIPSARQAIAEMKARVPTSTAATYYEGRAALGERKFDEASAKLKEVLRQYPNRADVHFFLGLVSYGQRNAQQAKTEVQKALELDPQLVKARLFLAQLHLEAREFDLVLKQTDELFKSGRVPGEAVVVRATALLGQGKPADGRALLEKLVVQAPGNARAQERLGFAYLAEKKIPRALDAFSKALEADPKNLGPLAASVRVLASQNRLDEGAARVEAHLKKAGESAGARELLAQLFVVKKDLSRARKEFERAIELDPNAVSAYLGLASLHKGPDAVAKAIADADRALAKSPRHVQAWMLKGALQDQAGQYDEANKSYRKALEIEPGLVPALNNLAWNLAEHGGNIDEALKFAEKAVELAPKAPSVGDTLGWIYVKKGVFLKALAQLEPAVEALPKNPTVLYHAGVAYAASGDGKKALISLERALSLSKDFPGADDATKLLEKTKAQLRGK